MSPGLEQPFSLSVPHADLELLRTKLEIVRFPDELEGAGWDHGAPLADIKRLVSHWKEKFDWRKVEAEINKLPMFIRDIEVEGFGTLNIHYVHLKSEVVNAIPLLLVHGWPGHFLEEKKLFPLLTSSSSEHPSFHVVALSLPGFGFSEAAHKPGFAGRQYAEVLNKLMLSLGYEEYAYHGTDWGHTLGVHAVHHYGHKHIKAWHSNFPFYRAPTLSTYPRLYLEYLTLPYLNKPAYAGLVQTAKWRMKAVGYYTEQATQPQTIGYSLADSPVGLLAWIYEKLVSWTDGYPWTDDEVIEWVSIYWFSRAGPTAAGRIYYEMTGGNTHDSFQGAERTTVPLGLSYFPEDLVQLPRSWMRMIGDVVFESQHDKGGHFPGFEQPEKLAGDLRKMFAKGGPAHGVVPGKNGFDQ
ncbi:alpha/beta-hydrolase [Trametes elegans]|nr:alpha/beta-hydrolase [Trametes elegans]